jgi:hypothetical protein
MIDMNKGSSKIAKSIPMKYHTMILENIYDQIRILAEGILGLRQDQQKNEVSVDHIYQELNQMNLRLATVENSTERKRP